MAAGFRLRGYTVERLLGRGSSGEVWRARVASSGEPVALKRISTPDEPARARARTEAALLGALDHPNLVRLHSAVAAGDELVLVLDLADGGSLADLLAARGRLTPGEVITALAPVAAALAYLHAAGVTHGDVSAANVLFTSAGVPLLADVGVARLAGDDSGAEATPAYVDPAVAAGSVPGPPSDVFMLAGVALHALTGAPPWPAPEPAAALELAARGDLGDVTARLGAAGVGAAMTAVLARALNVDPHRRGTAAELALDLRHAGRPVAVELAAGRGRPAPPAVDPVPGTRRAPPASGAPSRRPPRRDLHSSAPTSARRAPSRRPGWSVPARGRSSRGRRAAAPGRARGCSPASRWRSSRPGVSCGPGPRGPGAGAGTGRGMRPRRSARPTLEGR